MLYLAALTIHNALRWIVLAAAANALYQAIKGAKHKTPFEKKHRLAALLFAHSLTASFVTGVAFYFLNVGPAAFFLADPATGISEKRYRFFGLEHSVLMVAALALAHIAAATYKKPLEDRAKHRRTLKLVTASLILILVAIPWPFREEVARPLFRAM